MTLGGKYQQKNRKNIHENLRESGVQSKKEKGKSGQWDKKKLKCWGQSSKQLLHREWKNNGMKKIIKLIQKISKTRKNSFQFFQIPRSVNKKKKDAFQSPQDWNYSLLKLNIIPESSHEGSLSHMQRIRIRMTSDWYSLWGRKELNTTELLTL